MRSLMQLAEEASSTPLSEQDIDWLHLLLADWQVLADLAAADLVLWLPADDGRFIAAAHCRPATSATVHVDDIIGLHLPAAREIDLRRALQTGQVVRSPAARWATVSGCTADNITWPLSATITARVRRPHVASISRPASRAS